VKHLNASMHLLAYIIDMVMDRSILEAAMRVFVKEGYDGATTKAIAKEAGVNEVTLFRKFKSKENILQAVIIYNRDSALDTLNSVFLDKREKTDLHTKLIRLSQNLISFMNERVDMMILLLSEGRRKPTVAKIISSIPKEMIKRLAQFFDGEIRQGKMRRVDPHLTALSFLGFLLYHTLMKGLLDTGNAIDTFVDIFVKGISINTHSRERSRYNER
jgi:AcrR family transcriptional regulator